MRAAIYARYSSDDQNPMSIEDQVRLCRERLVAGGGSLVEVYSDRAISGFSAANRPGLQALMAAARARRFDTLVIESLDRFSRGQADTALLYEELTFLEIGIISLSRGRIDEMHVGIDGLMNARFLVDLAAKTRRGLRGRVEAGRSGGGLCYGYRVVPGEERGRREIEPAEAAVVRRILADFATGRSPRDIAAALNRESIPAPGGGKWNASTIHGNRRRGTGILNNELYVGRLVWNRQRFVKNPRTGKRQARLNPEGEWQVVEVPELRIVEDAMWQSKEAVQRALEPLPAEQARRPKRLLAGLLHCHSCGGAMTSIGRERYGCSAYREKGTCDNGRTVAARLVEERVLEGLKEKLLTPDAMAAAVTAFHDALQRASRQRAETGRSAERELARIEKQIAGIMTAIKDGLYDPSMKAEMAALRARQAELEAARTEPSAVVDFHPRLPELYRAKIAQLQEALQADDESRRGAITILRGLLDRIVIVFGEERGAFAVEIEGRLASILALAHGQDQDVRCMEALVAGARNHRNLPVVFLSLFSQNTVQPFDAAA